jgi:hypothetical protein
MSNDPRRTGQIDLKQVFFSQLRGKLFKFLINGPLRGWEVELVSKIVNESIAGTYNTVENYLYNNAVTILNMNEHIDKIMEEIILPRLNNQRIR